MTRTGLVAAALGALLQSSIAASAPPADSLSLKMSSWGKPLFDWTVNRSGLSSYTASRPAPSGNFREYDLVTRSFRISPADFRRLEKLLAPARRFAGRTMACDERATDFPYGRIAWKASGRTSELGFDLGCRSAQTGPVHSGLKSAHDLVERLAARAAIVDLREVREGSR
jgi:hypothetical protein